MSPSATAGPAADDDVDEGNALDPSIRLISYSGKDALKAALDARLPDRQKVVQFINDFRELRTVNVPSAKPAMELLEMGGLTGNRRARAILVALREAIKRRITSLNQDQLEALLDRCYSYLTIPELASIGIATLERMTYVDPGIWSQIVENGLTESPYVDLPVSIKRRIWVSEMAAFDHEIGSILTQLPELPAADITDLFDRKKRKLQPQESPSLQELMRMTQGLSEELIVQAMDKMVETAAVSMTAKRNAIANLFHDFIVRLAPRPNSNMGQLKKMAVFLDSVGPPEVDPVILAEVRDALTTVASCGPIALLVASTYSRDFLADALICYLLNRRGPVPSFEDEASVAAASQHVREDPVVPNLTYLCVANMRADVLLTQSSMLNSAEVSHPFELFYPMMINEMHADVSLSMDQYFTQNATVPHDKLQEMVRKGRLERRVLTSYCLQLCTLDIPVGLSRFRLLLDIALGACDSTEETREGTLAAALIERIIHP